MHPPVHLHLHYHPLQDRLHPTLHLGLLGRVGLLLRRATGLGADPAAMGGGLPPPQRRHLLRRRREAQGAVEPRVHSRSKPELNVAVHGPEPGDQHPTALATLVRNARDISGGVPRRLDKTGEHLAGAADAAGAQPPLHRSLLVPHNQTCQGTAA